MNMTFRKPRGRVAGNAIRTKSVRSKTFPAPVNGWVTADSLIKARPASALRLENIFPLRDSARVRGGKKWWSLVSGTPRSFLTYRAAGQEKLFLSTEDTMWDVTATIPKDDLYLLDEDGDPLLDQDGNPIFDNEPVSIPDVDGGYYSYVNFATSGGTYYLIAVNGASDMVLYDGSAWTADPDFTNVNTNVLSHVSAYRNRLFFVENGTLNVWYLPVNSIAGVAENITLAGIFELGGAVLFTTTWSMDAGDGLDDKFVVISTQGEVAVFQGSDPGDAADWSLVGRYFMTAPLGMRAIMRAGGDVVVGTEEAWVPVSSAVSKDPAALSLVAASEAIEPDWSYEARTRREFPWEIVKWPSQNLAYVSLPTSSEDPTLHYCFTVNIQTGAWCKYTGWNIRCMDLFQDQIYFAEPSGTVYQAEQGGDDDGIPYNPLWVGNFDDLKEPGKVKTIHQVRAHVRSRSEVLPKLSISTNYRVSLPAFPPAATAQATGGIWDTSLWDGAVWDGGGGPMLVRPTMWQSVGATGYAHAPQFQMTCSDPIRIEAEIIELTYTYESGSLVV